MLITQPALAGLRLSTATSVAGQAAGLAAPLPHPFAPHEGSWLVPEPPVALGIIAATALYLWVVGPLRQRYNWAESVDKRQTAYFLAAMAVAFVSLQGPLHELGDYYLLSAHMVQHLLVTMIMPPLLLKGLPGWLVDKLLAVPLVYPIMRRLTSPLVALGLFTAVFLLWHAPQFYQAALGNELVHATEHQLFMGTALLMWWPVFSTSTRLPRLSDPASLLYLFVQSIAPTILGAIITFAGEPIYPYYGAAFRVISLSALDDQQAAGLIMWLGGAAITLFLITIRFFRWLEFDKDDGVEAVAIKR